MIRICGGESWKKGSMESGEGKRERQREREGGRKGVREDENCREHFRDTEKGPSEIFVLVLICIYVRGSLR